MIKPSSSTINIKNDLNPEKVKFPPVIGYLKHFKGVCHLRFHDLFCWTVGDDNFCLLVDQVSCYCRKLSQYI